MPSAERSTTMSFLKKPCFGCCGHHAKDNNIFEPIDIIPADAAIATWNAALPDDSKIIDQQPRPIQAAPIYKRQETPAGNKRITPEDLENLAQLTNRERVLTPRYSKIPTPPTTDRGISPRVIFHLIRHGQSKHNSLQERGNKNATQILDPELTDEGITQSLKIYKNCPPVSMILVSPSRRALQTAVFGFNPHFLRGKARLIAHHDFRELGYAPCNQCIDIPRVQEVTTEQGIKINLDILGQRKDWATFTERDVERVSKSMKELYSLHQAILWGWEWNGVQMDGPAKQDAHVAVVAHGDLLWEMAMCGRDKTSGTRFRYFGNAERRSFVFAPRIKQYKDNDPKKGGLYLMELDTNCQIDGTFSSVSRD